MTNQDWGKPAVTEDDGMGKQEGDTENETGMSQDEKNQRKQDRIELKMACLQVADGKNGETPENVVKRARAYYAFVTGTKIKEG